MAKKNKSNAVFDLREPWEANDNSIWLATNLRLYRNINKFSFAGKLSPSRRQQVLEILKGAILDSPELVNPQIINAEEATPIEKEYLFEHFLAMHGFHQAHAGEAFVIDDSSLFLGVLNVRDHLQLQITDCTGEIEEAWNRLLKVEMAIGQSISYAFNNNFGFLTADPTVCGTGLIVYTFLQLPALVHSGQLAAALKKHHVEGIETTGLQGDPNNLVGDVVVLYNNYSLGLTEESIVTAIRSALTRLYVEEKSVRARIRDEGNDHIKDAVSRAYGLLMHSYQVETVEALGAISLLKLGLEFGWITGTTIKDLNLLFFHCRRGHLLANTETDHDPETVLHNRAELVHRTLKNSELKI